MLAFYNSNSKKYGDAVQNINKKQNAIYAYQIIPYFIQHIKQKTYKMFQMKYLAIWSKNISLLSAHSSNFCISDGTGVHQHLWNWHLTHVERHHQCCWRLLVYHEQLQSHAEQWKNMSLPKSPATEEEGMLHSDKYGLLPTFWAFFDMHYCH